MKVPEYFQFDPTEDYLKPPMQGHRLVEGQYLPIAPIEGRLPSDVLELHLERRGTELRLHDPATGRCLLTPPRRRRQRSACPSSRRREAARQSEAEARHQVEAENERLRRELEALRRGQSGAT